MRWKIKGSVATKKNPKQHTRLGSLQHTLLKQQSRRRPPTPDGFAFVPIVPCSRTASVGLSNRPVKQRACGWRSPRPRSRTRSSTKEG